MSADAVTTLREQIRKRNQLIDELRREIQEKDAIIAKLSSKSSTPLPASATLSTSTTAQQLDKSWREGQEHGRAQAQQEIERLRTLLAQKEKSPHVNPSSHRIDPAAHVDELEQNLANTRSRFRSINDSYMSLRADVKMANNQLHRFYLQRQAGFCFTQSQLSKGLPAPFPSTPTRGTTNKRIRGGNRGARARGRGGLTRSSEGSQNVAPRSRYPPGTYPLAILTPNGVPLILFVSLETTENSLSKLLKEELESLLLRVRGNQTLFGYPYPPPAFLRPEDDHPLVPLIADQPILQQNFMQPYRTAGAIAVVSLGDSSALTPSPSPVKNKVSDQASRPTKERKREKTPQDTRTFQTMRTEPNQSPTFSPTRSPKTYTLHERRMRSSTEMVQSPITFPPAPDIPKSREKNPVKSIWPPVTKNSHSEHAREQLKGKKSTIIKLWITVKGSKHEFHFPGSATEQMMKRMILQRLHPELSENQAISEALRYNLKVTGTSYFIAGGESYLKDFPIVTFCEQKRLKPMLTLVNKDESKADKLVSIMIGTILSESAPEGFTFEWLSMEDNDASDFRIRMSQALGEQESFYSPYIHAEVAAPPPSTSNSKSTFTTRVYLDDSDLKTTEHMRVTIAAPADSTINSLISSACKKFALSMQCNFAPEDYILCVAGQACYIPPKTRLGHLVYVQQCNKLQKDIYFILVPKTRHPSIPELCRLKASDRRLNEEIALNSETPFDSATVAAMGSHDTVSLLELKTPVEFRVVDVQNLSSIIKKSDFGLLTFHVAVGIYFGGEKIPPEEPLMVTSSNSALAEGTVRWRQWLRSTMRLCDLPEDSRLCITLWSRNSSSGSTTPLANVNCSLFDFKDRYRTGKVKFRMWTEGEANPIGTCMENLRAAPGTVPLLTLSFHSFPLEVAYPVLQPSVLFDARISIPNASTEALLKRIVASDPLYRMPSEERQIVWKYRDWLRKEANPRALVKILECVTWYNVHAVRDTYRLLSLWSLITPVDALQLLDAKFANRKVREYAVRCLNKLDDRELKDYLLQLVQALKYEPNHFSPLAVWLVKRALQSPMLLGVPFFWMLKSEIHVPEISERYALLLEMYLRRCGSQREDLFQQARIVTKLNQVALSIKSVPSSRRKQEVQKRLAALDLPSTFQLPLDAKRVASGIVTEKCKSMDSAKAPLWLVFKNADPNGEAIWLIFKSGDDLRQDLLTLQMLGIMDRIWKMEKLDLCLTPYKCVATGDEMGMIETVLESDTAANIQKAAGGVTGALKQTPLANWIRKHNPGEAYDRAVWNFTRSCAGYCVATYVLGIGDRHNDNIMVNQQGFLFHIDFGHFLGHYKTIVLNVRRERAPFVLTPEFANVMGSQSSDNFSTFVQLCCDGYNIIRRHANVFINLFAMMVQMLSTGIPELQSEDDIQYLRKALQMDLNEEEAAKHFTKLIKESIESMSTQIMFVTHILAHMK